MENSIQVASATSLLSLFQTNKEQRKSFVEDVVSKVEDGVVDPLQVQLQLKCMEDLIKQINSSKEYKDSLVSAAEKMGGKSFEFHNSKMELREVGVKYNYENCNDSVLNELSTSKDTIDESLKQRQDFLKTVPQKGLVITDETSGETFTVYPPSKTSTTSLVTTLK